MVIGMDVVCRGEPTSASPVAAATGLGEVFHVRDMRRTGQPQAVWYAREFGRGMCWIVGSFTAPFTGSDRPDSALVALI